jgi:hypothetical protein
MNPDLKKLQTGRFPDLLSAMVIMGSQTVAKFSTTIRFRGVPALGSAAVFHALMQIMFFYF